MFAFLGSPKVLTSIMILIAILTGVRTALQVYMTIDSQENIIRTDRVIITPDALRVQSD